MDTYLFYYLYVVISVYVSVYACMGTCMCVSAFVCECTWACVMRWRMCIYLSSREGETKQTLSNHNININNSISHMIINDDSNKTVNDNI